MSRPDQVQFLCNSIEQLSPVTGGPHGRQLCVSLSMTDAQVAAAIIDLQGDALAGQTALEVVLLAALLEAIGGLEEWASTAFGPRKPRRVMLAYWQSEDAASYEQWERLTAVAKAAGGTL